MRLHPHKVLGERLVSEDMVSQGIFAEHNKEEAKPLAIVVGGLLKHDKDEGLDVDNGHALCLEGLVGVKGSRLLPGLLCVTAIGSVLGSGFFNGITTISSAGFFRGVAVFGLLSGCIV